MEIIGKLIQLTPERRGESARGPWVSGGFIIETEEQFSRKIAFSVWGEDRLTAIKSIPVGTTVKVSFTIESREYNERWYTDCRCNNVEVFTSAMPQNPYGQMPQGYQMPPQGYAQPMGQPQMPQQPTYAPQGQPQQMQQPVQQPTMQSQMPQQDPQMQYQQPPSTPNMGGTIEQDGMPTEGDDDLPF